MIKVLKNGEIYAPNYIGRKDILIFYNKIYKIGNIQENFYHAEVVDCTNMIICPGIIDQHLHILGGGGENGPSSRIPEIQLSTITKSGISTAVGVLGRDYRVLVVGNKVSAVAERRPPAVVGDGIHTIEELIKAENDNPLRGECHKNFLTKIEIDPVLIQVLEKNGLTLTSIPVKDKHIILRENANLSTGGYAFDCTDLIHPYNSECAIKATKALGLDIAGVDIKTDDISKPINETDGAIIEVNAAPGLRMHLNPCKGKPVNVAKDIVDFLFPESEPSSIPIISVTGTNGKTITTRLINHTLSLMNISTGMTTSGIYVKNKCILKGDNTGPVSAKMLLSNKDVEIAILETARGGIVKKGLGYDLADIGLVINISDDHLMLDGIETLEELAHVKSLVVEAVKPGGYAVLNADDHMEHYFLERVECNKMLFSSRANNPLIIKHIRSGGKAVYLSDNYIVLADKEHSLKLINVEKIPITYGGFLECNIENCLAATSALLALGIQPKQVVEGLLSFKTDCTSNPGRFNLFDFGNFKVLLDYSHNYASYNSVINFIKKLKADRLVGVIGMPGDRQDQTMLDIGKLCGENFAKLYIKEDKDLRGRKPGEVADIIKEGALKGKLLEDDIQIILSEQEALNTALSNAQNQDLIIMFYEDLDPALDIIKSFQKKVNVAK